MKTPTYRQRLGAAIRRRREELGMSLDDLGKHVGSSRQAVYFWEHGLRGPSLDRLPKLVKALGLSFDELLSR